MNWDQFKQGSWWFLEIRPNNKSADRDTRYVFVVTALRKRHNFEVNKVKVRLFPVAEWKYREIRHYMDLAIDVEDPEYAIAPLKNRQAALDLLDLLRRNE